MKALTIWQPWASLLVSGQKKYETRSWATAYRGPIAIHAAMRPVRRTIDALAADREESGWDVLERLDSLREPQRLRTWFTRILVNECLDMLRRRKRRGGDASLDADPGLMPALPDGAERSTEALAVYQAVEELPPKLRTVVLLRFFEDMTLAEVAESAGCTLSTAKSRLYRALGILRLKLGEEDWL